MHWWFHHCWVFPGFLECGSSGQCWWWMLPCRGVCVCFLLCHNDDVAVATMHTGASARAPSAMLNVRGHSSLLRNSGSQGLLGSGINPWEETAEACVASALANQHSSCSNLCRPVYNSQLVFLVFFCQSTVARPRQRPGPMDVKRRRRGQSYAEVFSCSSWVITGVATN